MRPDTSINFPYRPLSSGKSAWAGILRVMAPINHRECHRRASIAVVATVLAVISTAGPTRAQDAVADFYKSKTVSLVVTTAGGTGYDYGARVLSRHLGRHVPGNPTVVVQNRPGGGGRTGPLKSIPWRRATAPSSARCRASLPPIRCSPGHSRPVRSAAIQLAGLDRQHHSLAVDGTPPGQELHRPVRNELIVGGVGAATPMVTMPYLFSRLLGMKFKVVAGYQSGNESTSQWNVARSRAAPIIPGTASAAGASRLDQGQENQSPVPDGTAEAQGPGSTYR